MNKKDIEAQIAFYILQQQELEDVILNLGGDPEIYEPKIMEIKNQIQILKQELITPWQIKQIELKIQFKKQFLIKLQETYDWHNKQAMGTIGGESADHENEIIKLIDLIKDIEWDIKDLERQLINYD